MRPGPFILRWCQMGMHSPKHLKMHSTRNLKYMSKKPCTWWLTKKVYLNAKGGDAQLNTCIHKTLNLWHSIGHQSQTLPEFKSEKTRLFSTSSGLKTALYTFELPLLKTNLRAWFLKDPKKKHDMDLIKMKSSDRAVTLCWYSNTGIAVLALLYNI